MLMAEVKAKIIVEVITMAACGGVPTAAADWERRGDKVDVNSLRSERVHDREAVSSSFVILGTGSPRPREGKCCMAVVNCGPRADSDTITGDLLSLIHVPALNHGNIIDGINQPHVLDYHDQRFRYLLFFYLVVETSARQHAKRKRFFTRFLIYVDSALLSFWLMCRCLFDAEGIEEYSRIIWWEWLTSFADSIKFPERRNDYCRILTLGIFHRTENCRLNLFTFE